MIKFFYVLDSAVEMGHFDVIKEFEKSLNFDLEELENPETSSMPTLNQKLDDVGMSYVLPTYRFLSRVGSLAELKKPLVAALMFAANGPHTRREYEEQDHIDIEAQRILINGFIGHLKEQLDKLDQLKEVGKEDKSVELEAQNMRELYLMVC